MSTGASSKRHRQTRSAAMASATASSQAPHDAHNLQNTHQLNLQAHIRNSQMEINSNPSVQPAQPAQPTTPPRTPQKDLRPSSENTSTSTAPETGSKQRPRNKNRPKSVMTSPAAIRRDRNTPPLTGAQSAGIPSSARPINTPSTAAYAGSTFHASPAPSALPIPSFYSKSVPDSPGVKGLRSMKEAALPLDSSTPPRAILPIDQFQREESPLDVFFKADRAEKARASSASSSKAVAGATGPFPPPLESPHTSQTPPTRSRQNRARPGNLNRNSSSGMFAMELDGDRAPGTPFGPAFSTPYSERINAARFGIPRGESFEQSRHDAQSSLDQSEALKAYLFSSQPTPSVTHPTPSASTPPTTYQSAAPLQDGTRSAGILNRSQNNGLPIASDVRNTSNGPRTAGRSSGLRQEVTPSKTPTRTPGRSNAYVNPPTPSRNPANASLNGNNFATQFNSRAPTSPYSATSGNSDLTIQGMENSLRKILKLDSSETSISHIGQVPAASVSSPSYAGGRPPPMNWQA